MVQSTKIMVMGLVFFIVILGFVTAGFCADESLAVNTKGNVGIGLVDPQESLSVLNKGNNSVTFGIRGQYPAVTASGTNQYKQMEIYPHLYKIPSGVVDSGSRTGLQIDGYIDSADFVGRLDSQIGLTVFTGTFGDTPKGTINNSYGLFIGNYKGANTIITNSYGVYQEATAAKNVFNGPVCVGTITPGTYKLYVNGDMYATRIRTSIAASTWQDHVFEEDYTLLPLFDVEEFVKKNKHLPEVPSASEIEKNGLDTAEMLSIHMKKIEELTLYLIELKKENEELKNRIGNLEAKASR